MTEPGADHESHGGSGAASSASSLDIREARMSDGTRVVVVNGVPYADSDLDAGRKEAAIQSLRDEAEAWGWTFGWLYVVVPLVGLALLLLGTIAVGLADSFNQWWPALASLAFFAAVVGGAVYFVRRYPRSR